jgi:NADPH:quinone reductase-like Zn-dependent oxidoreductase
MIGGPSGRLRDPLPRMLEAAIYSRFVSQHMATFLADLNPKDLDVLRDLLQSGKLKPVIDKQYGLDEVSEAIRYIEAGHARGKVVIAIP